MYYSVFFNLLFSGDDLGLDKPVNQQANDTKKEQPRSTVAHSRKGTTGTSNAKVSIWYTRVTSVTYFSK